MDTLLENLKDIVDNIGTAPTLEQMPRRTLADKGIAGATAAHVIEEIHTPFNFAYLTFTTGSTAFQNIVGVTESELNDRSLAVRKAMQLANVKEGAHALITYAPLVNVFSQKALQDYKMTWGFLKRSGRDAFILALCEQQPQVIVGESSFINSTLIDAENLGFSDMIPRHCVVFCAGTPLNLALIETAARYDWAVHDFYGCQEFGWLMLDGIPLREDISFIASPAGEGYFEVLAGGLPLADSFPISEKGHVCNREGKVITYQRRRTDPEYEVYVMATTFPTTETISRAARTMLRIKSRVVKISPTIVCNAEATELAFVPSITATGDISSNIVTTIRGPEKTRLFDSLVQAQVAIQSTLKTDPTWIKSR